MGTKRLDAMTIQFLEAVGDDELLAFLRRLPMVAGTEDGTVTLADLVYEIKLWPFVKTAWDDVDGQPGIAGRLRQVAEVYNRAEAELQSFTGYTRRQPRVIDIPAFLKVYAEDGLP